MRPALHRTSHHPPLARLQPALHRAIIAPSHAQPSCTSPAPTPLLPALRPDRLHSAPACTLLRPALLPAPALLCTSFCALHQVACTVLALLHPTAGNDAPARPSHHQHSTPLPPCTPRLTPIPRLCTADLLQPPTLPHMQKRQGVPDKLASLIDRARPLSFVASYFYFLGYIYRAKAE
ncbi:hypothetical protein SLEP1_g25990 [Rubroshorea leprosula]|uniref:Uncharacterized protein n=1 Tax=Rubroshorea leprosula TaxID=152421 RepID=A0AAV5JKS4_9ROSI|nr:hypothetical protein SLEP1_g25990 [Rubroshorea leprosula]